jgi:uncharacterized protein (TIGR00255 family)
MTGFGAAEGVVAGGRLRFEVRSHNHRHFSVQTKLPPDLTWFEGEIRERLRSHVERGHLAVSARWAAEPQRAARVSVDGARARAVVEALRAVGRELDLAGDVDLATVARIPDVIRVESSDSGVAAEAVAAVLDEAARECAAAREREGRALVEDLRTRLARLRELARSVALRAPERLAAERERLGRNVAALAGGVAVDPSRLAQEIAFLADRMDVTEELVRFGTHVSAMERALGNADKPVGRHLGFLLQELLREANTVGSKANDAAIAEAVIEMKGELEKMREQVENLE